MNVVAPIIPDLHALIAGFALTAAQRDRAGGHAATEKAQIRQAGLLAWPVPAEHGGAGKDWPEILRLVRRIATADGSLAHLYGYHALQIGTIRLYANPEQAGRLLGATAREHLWWGNANNPLDARLVAEDAQDGGFILNGRKGFASGARGSRHLNVSALHQASGQLILVTVPTDAPGITVRGDWDAVGQRQTDSGTVEFEQVAVRENIRFGLRHAYALEGREADPKQWDAVIEEKLAEVGLHGISGRYPAELSGGMQQRVAIARALASRPCILLLDEPFSAVDALSRAKLQDLLLHVWRSHGLTILFVTHDIDEALYLSDRVIVLAPGGRGVEEDAPVALSRPRDQIETRAQAGYLSLRGEILHRVLQEGDAA